MDDKNIKIVTFYDSDSDGIYGKYFSAVKPDNVSSYNDAVIEVGNELREYPNSIWIGNIDAIGTVSDHDKSPFTCRYMLSCDGNGKPYRFLRRVDISIPHKEWCSREKDIQVICFESTDIYDVSLHEIYVLDTINGKIEGVHATTIEDMDIVKNCSICCFISDNVMMVKDYCDLFELDEQYNDKGEDNLCFHYFLYNTKYRNHIGFFADVNAIEPSEQKRSESEPIVFDMLSIDSKGTERIDGVVLRLDKLTIHSKEGEDLIDYIEKD